MKLRIIPFRIANGKRLFDQMVLGVVRVGHCGIEVS